MSTAGEVKPRKHTKLHYCNVNVCEGVCCSDGAFLLDEEVRRIHRVVKKNPGHFALLPENYIVVGEWEGQTGPQTNVRKFLYKDKPEHFKNTRCVFTEVDGKCSLQTLAVKQGVHNEIQADGLLAISPGLRRKGLGRTATHPSRRPK